MYYTKYIDAFTVVFTIGVCLTGLLILTSTFICIGYCGI